jgi:hypothetical protein
MNVEIGAEAALFPEKEYINGIFVAVLGLKSDLKEGGILGNKILNLNLLYFHNINNLLSM